LREKKTPIEKKKTLSFLSIGKGINLGGHSPVLRLRTKIICKETEKRKCPAERGGKKGTAS